MSKGLRSQPENSLVKRMELEERPWRGNVPAVLGDTVAGPERAGGGET